LLYLHVHFTIERNGIRLRPLQISPETAIKLAEALNIPLEQLMHMPQHILLQKMDELNKKEEDK
jgi:plasmid maintenance system antidote protein VapI